MMRCVVPNCKNDSRHISKTEGITFHVFPTEVALRAAWLKALGRGDWQPKERSAICSEHFLADDLYWTKNGLRKVRTGAIPIVMLDPTNYDYGEPSSLKVCRMCLAMNINLFSITNYKLEQAFENLTGINLYEEDRLPQKLCYECSYKLISSNKLRIKALRANTLMLEVLKKQDTLTIQSLQLINRGNNQLNSSLSIKSFEPDHADAYIEYEDKPIETEATPDALKDENNKIFIEETDALMDEVKSENEFTDLNFDDEQTNYDNCDKEDCDVKPDEEISDFSSDDSLPLTQKVKKKKTKRVVKKIKKSEPKIDRRRRPFLNPWNDTLFTIIELSKEEQIAEVLKRKESANYKNSVYKCIECFKGFLDEDAYNSHMMRHTVQSGDHRCDICKTHFKNNNALRKHLTAHHMQRFSCNQCSYVTTHRQTARLHERWHKGTKYKCPHCPDEFVKFTTYMGHIRIKHPSDFVCGLCGYSFVSEKGIDLHKKLKHRVDEPMEIPLEGPYCEVCEVRFLNAEALATHIRVSGRHTTEKAPKESNKAKTRKKPRQIEKETCDNAEEMERRIYPSQLRKAEGPIPCEQCGLQLEDSRAYHGHFRRMHPDKNRTNYPSMRSPCMCEVCGRIFQSFALLRDHTWLHTGERPFKCELCGKAFRMKQRLVAHRRVHSQEKATYDCSVCGKHFSTHSNRQRHMFIHTGLKPFKCEMCGKGFKHASEKRAHIEYVHMKKPWPKRSRGKRRQEKQQDEQQWGCDPKMDIVMMDDKPMYYNLKM